jgi:hypothetical protein
MRPSGTRPGHRYPIRRKRPAGIQIRAMIAKDFIITKDLCTYAMIFLPQEKILRDH